MLFTEILIMLGCNAAAGIIAYFMERRMSKQEGRKFCSFNVALPCLLMTLLFACCPNPMTVVKGFVFTMILYYASAQDIHRREVDDFIPVMATVTALIGFEKENLFIMLGGALLTALPLFAAAYFGNGRGDGSSAVGGADIKLMAAAGLILGVEKGLAALMIGLLLGVLCTLLFRKIKKADLTTAFPLVPYLSVGCYLAYLL